MVLLDLSLTDPTVISKISKSEEQFLCFHCKTSITEKKYIIIIIKDTAYHTFSNPHGLIFNIITFSHCENVHKTSEPINDYSWFEGYSWSIINCAHCQEHLGWHYTSVNKDAKEFFAMIREKIIISI